MKFRLRAAAVHLLLSVLVAAFGLYMVFALWHPEPLQKAVGVTRIFLLLLAVDVVLGPLLTLVVASSPTKKTLKFDLAVIGVCQLLAYGYGMHSIAVSRPVYIAFDRVRFEVVQADAVLRLPEEAVAEEFARNPWGRPQWVGVRPFRNAAEQQQRTFDELTNGISPSMRADYYQPLADAWPGMLARKHALAELAQYNAHPAVAAVLQAYPDADAYLPLKAPDEDMTVLLDTKTETVLATVDLRPW